MRWLVSLFVNQAMSFFVPTISPGNDIPAEVARLPSPLKVELPVPAIVLINPVLISTTLILLFDWSAMKRFPLALDTHTPRGPCSVANVAAPPSPFASVLLVEGVPVPATVVMTPPTVTFFTTWPLSSPIYKFVLVSTKRPTGYIRLPRVAAALSPPLPLPA